MPEPIDQLIYQLQQVIHHLEALEEIFSEVAFEDGERNGRGEGRESDAPEPRSPSR